MHYDDRRCQTFVLKSYPALPPPVIGTAQITKGRRRGWNVWFGYHNDNYVVSLTEKEALQDWYTLNGGEAV